MDDAHLPTSPFLNFKTVTLVLGNSYGTKIGLLDFVIAHYLHDLIVHTQQEGVLCVAAGLQQRAAPGVFAPAPPELRISGADAVVVIDLAVVQHAKQALVNHGFGGEELAGKAALETDARLDFGPLDRLVHGARVRDRQLL